MHMIQIGRLILAGSLLTLPCCSNSDGMTDEQRTAEADPPAIVASGFPTAVPQSVPYLACDFPLACMTNRGEAAITQGTNIPCTRLWANAGQRLYLKTGTLPPGKYTLRVRGFYSEDGQPVRESITNFSVVASGSVQDTRAPAVISQSPKDQDFSVSPALSRIVLRFDEPVDLQTLGYSLSDGGRDLACTLETSVRLTDLVVCTILERLAPGTSYIFSLFGISDTAGNSLPVHFLLFATGSADGEEGHLAAGLVEHVVISEICPGGFAAGGASDEFIELYNPGLSPLDLAASGYRLYKASATGSPELLCDFANGTHFARLLAPARIPAQGFYLVVNQAAETALSSQADALVLKTRMSLAANNTVWLTRNGVPSEAFTVDCVGMGQATRHEGPLAAPQPANGMSLERKARQDSDAAAMGSGGRDELRGNALDRDTNAADCIIRMLPQPQSSRAGYEDWSR